MNKMYDAGFSPDPLLNTYYGEAPERYYSANSFPHTPISPKLLADLVSNKLMSFGIEVPNKTPKMVEEICCGFNECIRLNKSNELPQTLVFSPKTGSAKSVTAKVYIALLQSETALVVVPTVEDANTFCEEINDWSGNPSKAKCYYKESKENPESEYLVDRENIANPQCLVITHAMFKIINQYDDSVIAEKIKSRKDKLVIVDERLNHYNTYSISNNEVEDLITILEKVQKRSKLDFSKSLISLNKISELFAKILNSIIKSNIPKDPNSREDLIFVPYDLRCSLNIEALIDTLNLEEVYNLLKSNTKIQALSNSLLKSSDQANSDLKKNIKSLLSGIETVLKNEFVYILRGGDKELVAIESLLNGYGSIVVLDATATINQIYEDKSYYNYMDIQHIETTDPRIYDNLTIHRALNYPQSRSEIYLTKSSDEINEKVERYTKLAHSLLTSKDDKLLIITFKKFRDKLESKCTNENIMFTHWGNHVGKNKWSHCNKVMIIGWNYMTDDVAALNYINAVGSLDIAHTRLDQNTIQIYKKTQLVDDLIQATMRGSARNTLDNNGNCEKSDIYLFIPKNIEDKEVYELFVKEFKGAKEKVWNLTTSELLKKKSSPEKKADEILKYLDSIKSTTQDISHKTVRDEINMNSSTFSEIVKLPYFEEGLKKRGYVSKKKDGKSSIFIL